MAALTIHNNGDEIITDETITELLNNCSLAEKMIGTIRAEARRRIKDNASAIPGWKLKPGPKREKITDVQRVWERLSELNVKPEDFSSACSITKTALKPIIKFATDHKGKALDEDIKAVIDGCTTTTQSSPQLERIKEIE